MEPIWRVRPARDDDLDAIAALQARAGRTAAPASYSGAITDPHRLIVVATTGSDVVGWAKTHFWDHADGPAGAGHYLGGITVEPTWRRRGIGGALTQMRLEWIWRRDRSAWYVVNAANVASIELHRRWGFVQIAAGGRFHTTVFDDGDGLLMRANRPID